MQNLSPNLTDHNQYYNLITLQVKALRLIYQESVDIKEIEIADEVKSIFRQLIPTELVDLESKLSNIIIGTRDLEIIYDFENQLKKVIQQVKKLQEIHLDYKTKLIKSLQELSKKIQLEQSELVSKQQVAQYKTYDLTFCYKDSFENQIKENMEKMTQIQSDYLFETQMSKNKDTLTLIYPQIGQDNLERMVTSTKFILPDILQIMRQIGIGIKVLHDQGITAANICPLNIACEGTHNNHKIKLQIPNIVHNCENQNYNHPNNIQKEIQTRWWNSDKYSLICSNDFKSDILSFIRIMAFMIYPQQSDLIQLSESGHNIQLKQTNVQIFSQEEQLLHSIIVAYNRQEIQKIDQILNMFQQVEYGVFYPNEDQQTNEEEIQQDIKDCELICKKHTEKIKYCSGNERLCFLCIMDIYKENQIYAPSQEIKTIKIDVNLLKIYQVIYKCQNMEQLELIMKDYLNPQAQDYLKNRISWISKNMQDIDFVQVC